MFQSKTKSFVFVQLSIKSSLNWTVKNDEVGLFKLLLFDSSDFLNLWGPHLYWIRPIDGIDLVVA